MTVILKFYASWNEKGRRICPATAFVVVADTFQSVKSQRCLRNLPLRQAAIRKERGRGA